MSAETQTAEPDVAASLEGLAATALRIKAERDLLYSALKEVVRCCRCCDGSGKVISWDMDGGPPLERCAACANARHALRLARGEGK